MSLTLFDPYNLTVFWQCSLLCIFSEFESPPPKSQSSYNTIIVLLSFQRDLIYITMSEELHHAMPQKCVIGCAIFSTGLCSIVFLLQYLNYGEFTKVWDFPWTALDRVWFSITTSGHTCEKFVKM